MKAITLAFSFFIGISMLIGKSSSYLFLKRNLNLPLRTTVSLTGHYEWELLFDIDNSNNTGFVERTVTVKSCLISDYHKFVKSVKETKHSSSTKFNIGGLFEVINIGFGVTVDSSIRTFIETMVEKKQTIKIETTKTDVYRVGPNSRLKLYRLLFNGPGINFETDTLSSIPHKISDVIITLSAQLQQTYVLKDIEIIYRNDAVSRPYNTITEVDGLNPDINADFGGAYVYLVPIWTTVPEEGVTDVQILIQRSKNNEYKDLAKGAHGSYRYLKLIKDPISTTRIKDIRLWRTFHQGYRPAAKGWKSWTTDINQGRGKSYLYLCWDTINIV